jgi:hypothetical protein
MPTVTRWHSICSQRAGNPRNDLGLGPIPSRYLRKVGHPRFRNPPVRREAFEDYRLRLSTRLCGVPPSRVADLRTASAGMVLHF